MKAIIYEQRPPVQSAGRERAKNGETVEYFHPNLHRIGECEGGYGEVWKQAKKLTKCPVLEWK